MTRENTMTIAALSFADIVRCVREAARLLASYPFRWLIAIVAFLVVAESLMFIPYVGFVAKLAVAGLLGAQFLQLFLKAAAGEPPRLRSLFAVFARPWAAQLTLVLVSLCPFVVAVIYLASSGGWQSIGYFFGNILVTKPPPLDAFFAFKIVMYVASLPLTFIPAAVILLGATGWSAVTRGFKAAGRNWPVLLALLAVAIAFEWSIAALPGILPRAVAVAASVLMVLLFLALWLSFGYSLSARVFGVTHNDGVASDVPVARTSSPAVPIDSKR